MCKGLEFLLQISGFELFLKTCVSAIRRKVQKEKTLLVYHLSKPPRGYLYVWTAAAIVKP